MNEPNKIGKKIRGVNLGGWLVLEKWMTPSLFEGLAATDETTWCVELGERAPPRLTRHWDTFITEADFAWLAEQGINAVRIPLGFWIFGAPYPYHSKFAGQAAPFVEGGINILDQAFDWAEKLGLHIMLDLHAAPGCQNGFDNGGLQGVMDWPQNSGYIQYSLDILERLAARYQGRPALHAIEVLNEPRWDIPTDLLKDYTQRAYHGIRRHCRAEDVAVVFHDGFRDYREYLKFMTAPDYENVGFDIHRYQCFDRNDLDLDIAGHLQKAAVQRTNEADEIIHHLGLNTYVGEWSLGLDLKVMSIDAQGGGELAVMKMDAFQKDVAQRAYGAAQLTSFEKYSGWYFWSYKTETMPAWCFRECVERGWLPDDYRKFKDND